jgi:ribosomal protein S27E
MKFDERSHAWAYNRCECVECDQAYGVYPEPPNYATCENRCGAHTLVSPAGKHTSIYGSNFDQKVTTQGFNGGVWNGNDADVAVTKARSADMGRRQISSGNYKKDGNVPNVVFGTMCSGRVFGSLAQMEAMCDRDSNCHALHDHNCDGEDWRMCTYTVKEMQDADIDRTACSMTKIDDKKIDHNDKFMKLEEGQCSAGFIEGEELFVRGVDDCWKACRIADDCGFFSHAAMQGQGNNCQLYTKKAGCAPKAKDGYVSYSMKEIQ